MTERRKPTPMAAGYVGLLSYLVEAARKKGYALALHGSMNRDLDLIAVPWVEEAESADELVAALADTLSIYKPWRVRGPYLDKPHGRLCWNLHFDNGGYIDLTVMPRSGDPPRQPVELDEDLTVEQRHSLAWQFYDFKEYLLQGCAESKKEMRIKLNAANIPALASQLNAAELKYLQNPDRLHLADVKAEA